jgi:5-methylcytosine-specific restriction enzyme A
MPGDASYYKTKAWLRLRMIALERDAYTCTVPGCKARATHVDHVKSRRNGGEDTLANLRSLCSHHDSMVKERPSGQRASGKLCERGVFPDGSPRDPTHPWYTGATTTGGAWSKK